MSKPPKTHQGKGTLMPVVAQVAAAVLIALLVGTSAPWWLRYVRGSSAETDAPAGPRASELVTLAQRLREEFAETRTKLEQSHAVTADVTSLHARVAALRTLDPANGHAWYFAGESARLGNPTLFTFSGCVRPLAEPVDLDGYQRDFNRYLDVARTVPKNASDDSSGLYCYTLANGYCTQRTAWVQHLLANDLYEEARVATDSADRAAKLSRARAYVAEATKWRRPDGQVGFEQCRDTIQLQRAIDDELTRFPQL